MITLSLATAAAVAIGFLPLGPSSPPLPEAASRLPPTWPPAGWSVAPMMPGQGPSGVQPGEKPAALTAEADKWVQAFPHVRVNRGQKSIEFDGVVAWDFHNADTPRTELELLVCLPMRDKEHESLVLSKAKGTHVHAALLMIGLEPGTPGRIDFGAAENNDRQAGVTRVAPTGPEVAVEFVYAKAGKEVVDDARVWVTDEAGPREQKPAKEAKEGAEQLSAPALTFVFGGSKVGQMRNEQGERVNVYNADELGTLIGLCTFGSETIGLTRVYSPDSGLDLPSFVANNAAIPAADTAVRVRVSVAKKPANLREGGGDIQTAPIGLNETPNGR